MSRFGDLRKGVTTPVVDTAPSSVEEPPRPEEEIADMHEKAYKLARAKYNPFSIGGSESIHDFE